MKAIIVVNSLYNLTSLLHRLGLVAKGFWVPEHEHDIKF